MTPVPGGWRQRSRLSCNDGVSFNSSVRVSNHAPWCPERSRREPVLQEMVQNRPEVTFNWSQRKNYDQPVTQRGNRKITGGFPWEQQLDDIKRKIESPFLAEFKVKLRRKGWTTQVNQWCRGKNEEMNILVLRLCRFIALACKLVARSSRSKLVLFVLASSRMFRGGNPSLFLKSSVIRSCIDDR